MSQTGDGPGRGASYRTPRWVKVFGIVTLIVVLVIVVVLVTGLGGPHGPRRHGLGADTGGRLAWIIAEGAMPGVDAFRPPPRPIDLGAVWL